MRALTSTLLLAFALCAQSCVESGTDRGHDLLVANASAGEPNVLLAQLAERESAARNLKGFDAPPPPGVEANALRARGQDHPRASLAYNSALRQLADIESTRQANVTRPDWLKHPALDADSAVQSYVRGRDAVARQKYDEAMRELLLAHNFDARSPTVARELARVYAIVRNQAAAAEMYEHLLLLEPRDAEAVLALALYAADRRDFERAGSLIASFRLSEGAFDFDPAAEALAQICLVNVFDELGYDHAVSDGGQRALELLDTPPPPGMYSTQFGAMYRQRGDLYRRIGDARSRLGEFNAALSAYEESSKLPVADAWSLLPRRIYALLHLGRVNGAQHIMYEHLAGSAASDVDTRDVNLCAYLAAHVPQHDVLAEAVLQLHQTNPGQPSLVRCAASLVARGRAIEVLHAFVNQHAGDFGVLQQFLDWLALEDIDAAVDLVCTIAERHPRRLKAYAGSLLRAAPDPTLLLHALERGEPTSVRSCILAHVQQQLGAIGEAWNAAQHAVSEWPDDAAPARWSILLAAELKEPALLSEALAQAEQFDDAVTWAARAEAHRAMSDLRQAQLAAATAVTRDAECVEALLELARTQTALALAQPVQEDARLHAWDAVHTAEHIIASHPEEQSAYEILLFIFGAEGPLTNAEAVEEHTAHLASVNPASPLLRRLSLETAIRQRRYDRAVELALEMFEHNPTESGMLSYAVSAWAAMDDLDAANAWFETKRRERPHDSILLEQWARVKLQRSESMEAQKELTRLLAESPRNFRAMQLLEAVYRATGDLDRALELGEARLTARPVGVQRELALASMFAEAAHDDRAAQRLQWIVENGSHASLEQLTASIQLVESIEAPPGLGDELARTLIDRIVLDHPDVSMGSYLSGLHVMRGLEPKDPDRLEALLDCLLQRAEADTATGDFAALLWREIAQQLVDMERVDGASQLLRARLSSPNTLEPEAATVLALCTVIADAAGGAPPDETIEFLERTFDRAEFDRVSLLPADLSLADLMFEAGNVYTLLGEVHGAEMLMRKCLELDPRHAMALNNLGYQRVDAGHSDAETVAMVERAIELMPNDPNILDTLGWLRYKQGRFTDEFEQPPMPGDENADGAGAAPARNKPRRAILKPGAVALIREAMQHAQTPSAEVHDHLGDALWRSGDHEGAVREWQRAHTLLSDESARARLVEQYALIQRNVWRLLVMEPEVIWDREYREMRERALRKIEAAERGEDPAVAPLFDEMNNDEER
jgi:tetratricopeptide (TPR) repeat protein